MFFLFRAAVLSVRVHTAQPTLLTVGRLPTLHQAILPLRYNFANQKAKYGLRRSRFENYVAR